MSCDNCKQALELLEDCQQKLREVTKTLKTEPEKNLVYEPPCMDLYKDRLLLKITEAGALCGMSRSTAYQMLYNGEWNSIAIRLSERSIRISMKGLMDWVEQKREEI
ncbi:MAG: helix-turn-helix transcriptional regulator [Thermoleophilia bacterium]